jgi:prolipoprotein diacylglyceryltransferase
MNTILPFDIEMGILAGLAVAIAGYLQAYSKSDEKGIHEKFSLEKFVTTVLLGALLGGAISYVSLMDGAVTVFLATAGSVTIVESLVKAFLRLEKHTKK